MPRSLPTVPNWEHLKKQAKDLLKLHRSCNASFCPTIRCLNQFHFLTDEDILKHPLSLNQVQFALAMDYGFASWAELKQNVLKLQSKSRFLHIHCSESSARTLRESTIPGEVLLWREIYIEGPVRGDLAEEEFLSLRADFLSESVPINREDLMEGMKARETKLSQADHYNEVVLWFDPCMYDQTIMLYLLNRLAKMNHNTFSLVFYDKDWARLTNAEVKDLMNARQRVGPEEAALACRAWDAFSSPTPEYLEALLEEDCSGLPYLKAALRRHLQQLPSYSNGLNRSENTILKLIDKGIREIGNLFGEQAKNEKPPFMGDTSFFAVIQSLANAGQPVLKLESKEDTFMKCQVSLTEVGRKVMTGKADFIRLNGIDRWLGGIHLTTDSHWRWDGAERRSAHIT